MTPDFTLPLRRTARIESLLKDLIVRDSENLTLGRRAFRADCRASFEEINDKLNDLGARLSLLEHKP
jgi:hypothetical protein